MQSDKLIEARNMWEEATQALFRHRPLGLIRRRKKAKKPVSDKRSQPEPSTSTASYPFSLFGPETEKASSTLFISPVHPYQHHQQVLPAPHSGYYTPLMQTPGMPASIPSSPFMMAAASPHTSYQLPGHPMLSSALTQLPAASAPYFVVHMPKPPIAPPYDPLMQAMPHPLIPVHPLHHIIENLQQQAQAASDQQYAIHVKLKQAKEALATHHHYDTIQDEIERRKDTLNRNAGEKRKVDLGKIISGDGKGPLMDRSDEQVVEYSYDEELTTTPFPRLPPEDPQQQSPPPYGHKLGSLARSSSSY